MANDLDLGFSMCPKARLFENPPLCLSSGFAREGCWEKGMANQLSWALLRYGLMRQCLLTVLFVQAEQQGGDPSDYGSLQGSLFYGKSLNFMVVSDSNHPLFGPSP